MVTCSCPALLTVITPAHEHTHFESFVSAGTSFTVTRSAPGVHGVSTGTHGTGLPCAAITCGLLGAEHIPNGGMFSSSTSEITPDGAVALTASPDALNTEGAAPNVQRNSAPVETCTGIRSTPSRRPSAPSEPIGSLAPDHTTMLPLIVEHAQAHCRIMKRK